MTGRATLDAAPDEAREALTLVHSVGGDDLVATLLRTFLRYADTQVAAAEAAARDGDGAAIARITHALKSSASQVGAHAVGRACAEAERTAAGADPAALQALATTIAREYAAARTWMETVIARS